MSVICGPWLSQPHQQYSNLRLWLRHPASEPQPRPLKSLRQPPRAQNRQCCFNQLVDICRDSVTRVWRDQVMSPVKMFFDYKLSFVSPKNIFQEELKLKIFLFAKLGITFKGSEWLSFYRLLYKYIFLYVSKLTCVYWACLKDGPRVKLINQHKVTFCSSIELVIINLPDWTPAPARGDVSRNLSEVPVFIGLFMSCVAFICLQYDNNIWAKVGTKLSRISSHATRLSPTPLQYQTTTNP